MSEFTKSLSITTSGLRAQAQRLRLLSENIANSDTPGYRRKTAPFEAALARQGAANDVQTGPVRLDQSALTRVYDPGSPLADETGHDEGSNVNLII